MDNLLRKITLGSFHFLVVVTPLFFMFNTDELFEFNKMMLTYIVGAVIFASWISRMILRGELLFRKTPLNWALIIFVTSQLLSTILSMHPRTSWFGYYSRFHGGLLSTLTYSALFWAFVNNVRKKDLPAFWISIFGSGVLVSIYAILEHFGHSFSCLLVDGSSSFDVSCWKQKVQDRVFATFGQPNWLAAYCITLIPVGVVLAAISKKKLQIFYGIVTLLLTLTVIYTQSRSGMLGLAAGMAVLLAGIFLMELKQKGGKLLSSALLIKVGVISVIIAGLFLTLSPDNPIKRLIPQREDPLEEESVPLAGGEEGPVINRLDIGGTDSGEIRKIVWDGSLKVGQRYPLFGSGVETFAYSYYLDRPVEHNLVSEWDFLYNKAHNEFLNFLATTGIVGLAAYVVLLGSFAFVAFKKSLPGKYLSWSLLASVTALSVSNFFGFSTVMVSVVMFLYFAILIVMNQEKTEFEDEPDLEIESHHYLGFGFVAILLLIGLIKIYNIWTADIAYAAGKAYIAGGYHNEGISLLDEAIAKSPAEALFYDEISISYAQLAVAYAPQDATTAAQLAQAAIAASDITLELNDVHLNFYKTRARVFITLAQMDDSMLLYAQDAFKQALLRAPTDAKLLYNLGVIAAGLENVDEAVGWFEQSVELKANYGAARFHLGQQYQKQGKTNAAVAQYQYILENISPDDERSIQALELLKNE